MKEVFDDKRNTGCSAEGDSGGENKELDAQCIKDISENDAKKRENFLFEF